MKYCFGVVLAIAFSVNCHADIWTETGDAGSYPMGGFQVTVGVISDPMLTSIFGGTSLGAGDVHDAFGITILSSSWDINAVSLDFDTRLWLFDTLGNLVMSNDDEPGGGTDAMLSSTTTWGGTLHNSPADPVMGNQYILVVSGFDESLHDSSDVIVSQTGGFTDLNGYEPVAGAIDHWSFDVDGGAPETGSYELTMTGISFFTVPEPGAGMVLGFMGLGLIAGRRKMRRV
ncbi:MAG: hypothetical protein ACR2NP_00805 [Pirellulaceae bacterium]